MMKEKIIKLFKDIGDKQYDGQYTLHETYFESIADTLLAMFEQEKKEQAREIIRWFANETEKAFGENYLAERIAKEYGVEL